MKVNIVDKGPIKIIGMAVSTLLLDVDDKGPATGARFEERKHEILNRVNPSLFYAVSIDPINYNVETDEFKLVLGVEVDNLDQTPLGMESLELPLATYATIIKTDHSAFGSLYRWVNESEYELADIYSIDVHDITQGTDVLMFPIQKKK